MKTWIASLCFCLCCSALFGQKLSLHIGGGYGLPASSEDVGLSSMGVMSVPAQTVVYSSNGAGGVRFVEVGYRLQDYLAVQVGFEFLRGASITRPFEEGLPDVMAEVSEQSQQLRVMPALRFGPKGEKWSPYLKVGLSLPVWTLTRVYLDNRDFRTIPATVIRQTSEIRGKSLVGFVAGMGVVWQASSSLGISFEVSALSQRLKAQSGTYTRYESGNVDILAGLDTYTREWRYVKQLTSDSNSASLNGDYNVYVKEDRLQISQNFSSFQFRLGAVVYLRGGK